METWFSFLINGANTTVITRSLSSCCHQTPSCLQFFHREYDMRVTAQHLVRNMQRVVFSVFSQRARYKCTAG